MSEQSHINNNIALHIIDINLQCNVIRGHVTSCKSPKKVNKKIHSNINTISIWK